MLYWGLPVVERQHCLNALCGFTPVTGGEIWLDKAPITSEPAEKRKITMVFQSYALWPHMTVGQNIGFGLKVQKRPEKEISARIDEMLVLVGLQGRKEDKVTALSGGQRQRVALGKSTGYSSGYSCSG
ncbi:ATP-binding cassette domain-containing protein [Vibrio salinus]|uniref:ATP-binding cassette domain-containing protein n=1 Tax=Vibrio salinus TaxID=2899784 RepID=UPI001E5FDB7F|nr:ATP-binding cassette domain-containing protein [Vibrio salinus]MCE0496132.1 ATP-binding cassette domain-containing protein [Vibrio salinus]